ncbi:hypothetical protein IFM89_026538 [Coptis chinensis]|uniref:DNA-directed primase/polymerase protein n=1 Tax=Coptis chinensis TaxID=261450 RepID=A0A835LNM8_9MAGN|nr:hypothetical protein IFM89_026538 [Coptis chinensis]
MGKKISPLVFYGSPHGVPVKRPTRLLKLLHEIHGDLSEETNLRARKDIWATFPKQDQAMNFSKQYPHARLFSYQDHVSGQRRFLVSTYTEFWQRYKNMDSTFRHHYEVIQEGLPCHLYFDLEFDKRVNLEKNGEEMVDVLLSVIFYALLDKYSIHGEEDWVIELDSSTEEKFSRHLIIRVPKSAFKDNSHAGAFVAEVCSRICSGRDRDHKLQKLFVSKDLSSHEPLHHLFVDTAVYSRNRCFRLALSSKAGKKSILLPTSRFKCKNLCEQDMFMDSLICKMDGDCQKLLICKMDVDCMKTLCFDSEDKCDYENLSTAPSLALHACTTDFPTTYFVGKSPFPALDMFVESIASIGNVSGRIRSWYWFSEYGVIVYNMLRNRYCERIGRQHKSNHVMYVVDFKRTVYYQKCYDPDCKGYRSPFRPIPDDVIPDTSTCFNSIQSDDHRVGNNDLDHQLGQNEVDHIPCDSDQKITDSCKKDGWWLEAVKIADEFESRRKMQNPGKLVADQGIDDDEGDCEWWMAVERTTSQTEQQSNRVLL